MPVCRLARPVLLLAVLAAPVLGSLAAPVAAGAEGPAPAGGARLAPEIVLADGLHGVTSATTLASYRGSPVLLVFWIPICPHCQRAAGDIERIRRTYEPKGLKVIAVSHGKKPYVARWLAERGYGFGVGFDWTAVSFGRYAVQMLPGAFLIGKDGTVKASGLSAAEAALPGELARR